MAYVPKFKSEEVSKPRAKTTQQMGIKKPEPAKASPPKPAAAPAAPPKPAAP